MDKYLFILSPNNSGSSMLYKYLMRCKHIVALRNKNDISEEGQTVILAKTKDCKGQILTDENYDIIKRINHFKNCPKCFGLLPMPHENIWDCSRVCVEKRHVFEDETKYNWDEIKRIWDAEWAKNVSYNEKDRIFLEKSTSDILRPHLYQKSFKNVYFLGLVRNPYAVCEGIHRRNKYAWGRCVRQWVETAEKQIENIDALDNIAWFRYEDLCEKPYEVANKIREMLPELYDIDFSGEVKVHALDGIKIRGIINLNSKQIGNLSKENIAEINTYLVPFHHVLERFGYEVLVY